MRTGFVYLKLQYKQSIKILYKMIISTVVMLALVAGVTAAINNILLDKQSMGILNVGIAVPPDENQAQFITGMVSSMESVKSVCRFYEIDESDAQESVENGKLEAAIILPEGIFDDFNEGRDTTVTIYVEKNSALNVSAFEELIKAAYTIIHTSEAGVYAAMDTAEKYKWEYESWQVAQNISLRYVNSVVERERIFDKNVFSKFGKGGTQQYYMSLGVIVFMLMCGLNFSYLFGSEKVAVEEKLRSYNVCGTEMATIKILVMSGTLFMILTIITAFIITAGGRNFSEFIMAVKLIPVCVGISAYFNIVYTLSGRNAHSSVLLLGVNIIMIVCSGGIMPVEFLPFPVDKISSFLPLGYWVKYGVDVFNGIYSFDGIICSCILVVLSLWLGAFRQWKNI